MIGGSVVSRPTLINDDERFNMDFLSFKTFKQKMAKSQKVTSDSSNFTFVKLGFIKIVEIHQTQLCCFFH